MRFLFIAFLLSVLASPSARAGWGISRVKVPDNNGSRVSLSYYRTDSDRGVKSFPPVVERLAKTGEIKELRSLGVNQLFDDPIFQAEIFSELQKSAPKSLNAAKKSAGNMHNPKMHDLYPHFLQAVLNTPTIKAFNAVLAAHGMKISKPSVEKFELHKRDKEHVFWGFFSLSVEPAIATPVKTP